MRARGADGQSSAVAWVNLLSVYALANFPPHGTYSASKAAAHVARAMPARRDAPAGVRVINVFPGTDRRRMEPDLAAAEDRPCRGSPPTSSRRCAAASRTFFPATSPQEWLARWRDNPKALERELAAQQI